jgi:hypothetical protein
MERLVSPIGRAARLGGARRLGAGLAGAVEVGVVAGRGLAHRSSCRSVLIRHLSASARLGLRGAGRRALMWLWARGRQRREGRW